MGTVWFCRPGSLWFPVILQHNRYGANLPENKARIQCYEPAPGRADVPARPPRPSRVIRCPVICGQRRPHLPRTVKSGEVSLG